MGTRKSNHRRSSHPRILWVDDDPSEIRFLFPKTSDFDFDLDLASTVETAERKLGESKYDLVITDILLPEDDGDLKNNEVDLDGGYLIWFEIRILRKWPSFVDVPILIITARGRPEYRDQVVADTATRWLSKPVDHSIVEEKIKELLALSKTANELN